MIEVKDLHKSYGEVRALRGISFNVDQSEVLGLLGPNGAGKTTAMRVITGFLKPTAGEVVIDHLNVQESTEAIQQKIGYLPENTPLYPDLSVREHLEFSAKVHGITKAEMEQAIRKVTETCGLAEKLPFNVSELSKGYRQRLGLSQALIHDPEILILDEPTSGLDPNQIIEIRDLIKSLGRAKTVILSTHIMQEVEATCSRVIVINEGEIVASGTPAELAQGEGASHVTRVIVKGPVSKMEKALQAIKEAKEFKQVPGAEQGTSIFLVSAEVDLRSEISGAVIAAKLELLEISSEKRTMEEVFRDLTN
ncbi:MAG: ATP-binding cassette domain-containing protein [Patescibacteria group bacterium]